MMSRRIDIAEDWFNKRVILRNTGLTKEWHNEEVTWQRSGIIELHFEGVTNMNIMEWHEYYCNEGMR